MRFKFETRRHVTRAFVQRNRHRLFLFGHATKSMLNEPNAIGISTYMNPSMNQDLFFIDEEFDYNKGAIDSVFREVPNHPFCTIIVLPTASFPGWAELGRYAPRTLSYLGSKISQLNRTSCDLDRPS